MEKGANKRKLSRLPVYHLVKYRVTSQPNAPLILASAENISGGGVCLHTKDVVPMSATLQVYINFPQIPTAIPTIAKVMWVKRLKNEEVYKVGIQFLEIEDAIRQKVIDHLDKVAKEIDKHK